MGAALRVSPVLDLARHGLDGVDVPPSSCMPGIRGAPAASDAGVPPEHSCDLVQRHRRADIEWLRVLAMSVVFLAHVSLVFSPWLDYHVQSPVSSRSLGAFAVVVWPWALPLFTLLAGSAAWHALERRSARAYLRERVLRIFVPLLVGTIVVAPPQLYLRRRTRGDFSGSFLDFLPRFFLDGPYPQGHLSATHLWFLGYLFAYALVTLPLFVWLKGDGRVALAAVLGRIAKGPGLALWLFIPILVSQLWLRGPYPQNNRFVGDWANLLWMGLFYFYGFVLASDEASRRVARSVWPEALAVGALASTGMILMLLREAASAGDSLTRETAAAILLPQDHSTKYMLWWTLFSAASWSWVFFLVGAADRFLATWSPFLRWASPTIYPFYVFHQLVIVVVAAWVVTLPVSWGIAAATLAVVALAITVGLCEVARRWGPTELLFGLRGPRRRDTEAVGSSGHVPK